MSPQQDVSVRDLLAAGPAVSAICTPPRPTDADEPSRTEPGRAECAEGSDRTAVVERTETKRTETEQGVSSPDDDDLRP